VFGVCWERQHLGRCALGLERAESASWKVPVKRCSAGFGVGGTFDVG